MRESILGDEISLEATFCERDNHLLGRMPRDTLDVLTMLHHDFQALELGVWRNWGGETSQGG